MIKEKICSLLRSASSDEIKKICDRFYLGISKNHFYDQLDIAHSFSAILEPGKPVIFVDDKVGTLSTVLEKINFCEKSRIYIYNNGAHFTVCYLFRKQKKILYINSLNPGTKPSLKSLENKGYTLYVSSTKIQTDGYSCGPIASEIARMLHSNYEAVEDHLSKRNLNRNSVDLYEFLPKEELNQLCESFSKKITISYSKNESKLVGADYRTAHLMSAFTLKTPNVFTPIALENLNFPPEEVVKRDSQKANFQQEKQIAEEVRSFFIGKPDNVKWFDQEINKVLYPDKVVNSNTKNTHSKLETAPNIQKSLKSLKNSKLFASALIAGVILGITIAAYLEMLAVGIAVAICCLAVAATVFFYSKLSNLLGESNLAKAITSINL